MSQFASIALQTLNFTHARDGKGNSKPYIWPAVLPIDNGVVGLASPPVASAEVVVANNMHQGNTASIPFSVGQITTQIGDKGSFQGLIVAVVLWDQRDTPDNVVQSGYQAFSSELRAAIQDNLLALSDPSQREAAINTIEQRVNGKVTDAIEKALTLVQKGEILLGLLNLDTQVGAGFDSFQGPTAIALDIKPQQPSGDEYQIAGSLQLFPTEITFPPSLGFGKLPVGQPKTLALKITNVGTAAATVSMPPSPVPFHANFWWSGSGNHTISPGAVLTLEATFKPSKVETFPETFQFRFTSNAVGSPHAVELRGQGIPGNPQ